MQMNSKNPYYIVAPRHIRTSAECRLLYRLCDLVNKAGGSAFVFLRPYLNHDSASSPMGIASFLTKKTVDYHLKNELNPIVFYPETFKNSKFSGPVRNKYILNYYDLLCKNEQSIFVAMRCVKFPVIDLNSIRHKSFFCCAKF
jgi:hypothetical protein